MEITRFTRLDTLLREYPEIIEVFDWHDIDIAGDDFEDDDVHIWEVASYFGVDFTDLLHDLRAFAEQQGDAEDEEGDWDDDDYGEDDWEYEDVDEAVG